MPTIDSASFTALLQLILMAWIALTARKWSRRDRADTNERRLQSLEMEKRINKLRTDLCKDIREFQDALSSDLRENYVNIKSCKSLHVEGLSERVANLEGRATYDS